MSINQQFYSLLAVILVLSGCGNKNEAVRQGPPPVNVTVKEVKLAYAPYYDEYPGLVKALQEVELRAQVGGYISGIQFKEGDKVKKGQKLYTIDQQSYQANYQQALANIAVQESNLDRAQKDLERYQELSKKDAIAKQQLDYAETAYASAKQLVLAAKALATNIQTNLKYSTIVAPFDGTIGISLVRLGASVAPGQTLLNTISTDNPVAIEVAIDQSEISKFSTLLGAKSTDSTFQLVINKIAYPSYGQLSFIDRAVDPLTGTIKIRAEFPNPDFALRVGMSGSLRVLANNTTKSITVPYKSITEQLGEFYVYVSDGTKVTQRKVKLGKQIGQDIIVTEGLADKEIVVVQGVQNLREGSLINIPEATPNNQ